jgi:hypothetical protein
MEFYFRRVRFATGEPAASATTLRFLVVGDVLTAFVAFPLVGVFLGEITFFAFFFGEDLTFAGVSPSLTSTQLSPNCFRMPSTISLNLSGVTRPSPPKKFIKTDFYG